MAEILHKSTHPVFLKKIALNVWPLKQELEEAKASSDQGNNLEKMQNYFNGNSTADEDFLRKVPAKNVGAAQVILSDIHMKQVLFFCEERYLIGQTLGIQFNIPSPFILSCKVESFLHYARNSRVIGDGKAKYRIACSFDFHCDGEKHKLREFLKSIQPDIPPSPRDIKSIKTPQEEQKDEDDFEDLGL